jgi:hypothetical protein
MAFGALSPCVRRKKIANRVLCVLLQAQREAVADLVVEVEVAAVVAGIVEAEAAGGVDVRGSRLKPYFYSYWFCGQAAVCNRAAGAALSVVDADAAGQVVVVAIPGDVVGPGVVRRL